MDIPKKRNEVEVLQRIATSIGDGSKTVTTAGTAERLTTTATPCLRVIVTGKELNAGQVYIGGSTIATGRGIPLAPLQATVLDIDDVSAIYVDADNNGDGVTYAYLIP